jgi:membrane protease YdiL (CAAX protease family)
LEIAKMQDLVARHPVVAFVILNYFFTFLFRVPLAASTAKVIPVAVPRGFQFLGDYGPLLAALLLTGLLEGRAGIKSLCSRVVQWRVGMVWYAVALLGTLALFSVAAIIGIFLIGAPAPNLTLLGRWEELPGLHPAATWIVLIFTIGLGEEVGWRGFMLPKLQAKFSAFSASLLIGLAWTFWHLPNFIFDPQFAAWGMPIRLGFGFMLICMAIVYAWLFNSTRGSLLIPILFHGTNDFIMGSRGAQDPILFPLLWGVLFIGATIAIVSLFGPRTLSATRSVAVS